MWIEFCPQLKHSVLEMLYSFHNTRPWAKPKYPTIIILIFLRTLLVCCNGERTLRLGLGRAMDQAVNRRSLNPEARVCARSVHVGFVVGKVTLGQVFL
jgi:hypothetical protein